MATNIPWKDKVTNTQLYMGMPKIFDIIKQRRLRLAGHCPSAQLNCMEAKERHTK